MHRSLLPFLLATTMLSATAVSAQPKGEVGIYSDVTINGSIVEPKPITVLDDAKLAAMIKVPDGFKVEVVGRDLGNTRMLAVHGSHVYATRRQESDVIRLDDKDGDGKFEGFTQVAERSGMHGITFDGDTVYLVTVHDVYTAPVKEDGSFGPLTRIIDDLPDAGQHANRTLAIGPDGMLYITVGSTCNECQEPNPENATILRATKDGKSRSIFASHLRNTIGFGWEPTTGAMYGADHGIDWLGDNEQQEEFNRIEKGKNYGWPYIYDFSHENPEHNPPKGETLEDWKKMSTEPVLGYTAHSAPMQMAFYTGTAFPKEYQGDAFIAQRGSWNRRPPSGYEISRVDFENGKPVSWGHFATGFLIKNEGGGYGFLGRLAGLTQTPDGALLLADDFNGIIYRISATDSTPSATPLKTTADIPNVVPPQLASDIAINLVDAKGSLTVKADFEKNAGIWVSHAAEGHNASPPLSWSGAPDGTASYAIIVDDPDAKMPKPVTHWVVYNIPSELASLREGLPQDWVLQDPKNVRQGVNTQGQVGYFGPKPPEGDPAHHYHFQVFALDVASLAFDKPPTRQELLDQLKEHTLAKGEIVGTYKRPAPEEPAS